MRNFITTIFIFLSLFTFGQNIDSLTFDFINQYRVKSGKNILVWSTELHEKCVKHSNDMIQKDSSYHTHGRVYSENCLYGKEYGTVGTDDYKKFIKNYFGLNYDDVIKNINVFIATNVVYDWSTSPSHNKIMLRSDKEGTVHVIVKDLVKKSNFIFGKEFFKGWGPFYYKMTISSTFQIK